MPTLDFLTGFNHRVPVTTTANTTFGYNGGGSVALSTSTVRRTGGTSVQVGTTGTNIWQIGVNGHVATDNVVAVGYVYFSSLPTADCDIFGALGATAVFDGIGYDSASGKFCPVANGTFITAAAGGPVLTTGVWYRLEFSLNAVTTSYTLKIQVATTDGVATALTDQAYTGAAGGQAYYLTAQVTDGSAFFADIATSITTTDYPIGPITVRGYQPDSVGTHNLDAATSSYFFVDTVFAGGSESITALTTTETGSWSSLTDLPLSIGGAAIKIKTVVGAPTTSPSAAVAGTLAARTTSGALAPTMPTHQAGDLLIACGMIRSSTGTLGSTPAGWNPLPGITNPQTRSTVARYYWWYKVATSGAEAFSATNSGALDSYAQVYRIRGVDTTTPFDVNCTVATGTANPATTTGLTSVTVNDRIAFIGWAEDNTSTSLTVTDTHADTTYATDSHTNTTTGADATTYCASAAHAAAAATGTLSGSFAGTLGAAWGWGVAGIAVRGAPSVLQPTNTWYAEYNYVDESTILIAPYAVRAIVAHDQDSSASALYVDKLYDGTNVEDIVNTTLTLGTTRNYFAKTFAQRPNSGGAWTYSAFNAARIRFGYTNNVSGNTRLENTMLEAAFRVTVDYTESATITSVTSVSSSEIYTPFTGNIFTDAATASSVTSVSAAEAYDIVESATIGTVTSLVLTAPVTPSFINTKTDALAYSLQTGTVTSAVLTLPAYQAGDIVFVMLSTYSSGTSSFQASTPTGWTQVDTSGTQRRSYLYYRVMDGTEGSTVTWNFTGSVSGANQQIYGVAATYRGENTGAPLDGAAQTNGATTATSPLDINGTITTNGNSENVLMFLMQAGSGVASNVSATTTDIERMDIQLASSGPWFYIVENEQLTPGTPSLPAHASWSAGSLTWRSVTVALVSGTTAPLEYTQFVDSATVSSVTSASASELHEIPDSATVSGTTVPSSTEIFAAVDSSTVSSTTTPSTSDTAQFVDSSIAGSITTVSSVETSDLVDADTASTTTSPSGTEQQLHEVLDADTVTGVTTLTSVETADTVDSATVSNVTTPQTAETHEIPDSGTVGTVTVTTSADLFGAVDSSTLTSSSTLSSAELHEISDADTVSNVTSPSSTDIAAYVESDTVTNITSVTSGEIYTPYAGTTFTDADTVTSVTSLSSAELADLVDSSTVTNTTTPSAVEIAPLSDAYTIPSSTSLTATEVAGYVDSAIASSVTSLSSVELHEITDVATVAGQTTLSATEIAAYVESATVANTTTPSSVEIHELPDADTVTSNTILSSSDVAAFADSSTTTTTTTPQVTGELHEISDSSTVSGSTTPSGSDLSTLVDQSTVASSTSVTAPADVFTGTDTNTVGTVTTPFGVDVLSGTGFDLGTTVTTTSATAVEILGAVDANTVTTNTVLTSVDYHGVTTTDADTPVTFTVTYDSSDVVVFADAQSVNTRTSPSGTDVQTFVHVDFSTITTSTDASATEEFGGIDSDTISGTSTLGTVEVHIIPDSDTVGGTTEIVPTEYSLFVESGIFSTVTELLGLEEPTSMLQDAAVISTTTTFGGWDILYVVELVGFIHKHWASVTNGRKWFGTETSKFTSGLGMRDYAGSFVRKWSTWKNW